VKRSAPLTRTTRLKAQGGRQFQKRHDPAYWRWLGACVREGAICDGCGVQRAWSRSHLVPRSQGGDDRDNVALLCPTCDRLSEKRVAAFERETGVDLHAKARAHTARYEASR
jgi:5-methylcytosine-specific restriction endonuclease McrA